MRAVMLAMLGLALLAAPASAVTCRTAGSETFCDDGRILWHFGNQTIDNRGGVWWHFGNQTIGSDGTIYHRFGNVTVDNNGHIWRHLGGQTIGPDGLACRQVGSQVFCTRAGGGLPRAGDRSARPDGR